MKILSYKYSDSETCEIGWDFTEIELGDINLLVGISGSGKTKLLNTIFSFSQFSLNKAKKSGHWKVSIEHNGTIYKIDILSVDLGEGNVSIKKERIEKEVEGKIIVLVDRTEGSFIYCNEKLPKLASDESSISLMKEEDEIKPLFDGLKQIFRSDFSTGKLKDAVSTFVVDVNKKAKIINNKNLLEIFSVDGLSDRLDILKQAFPDIYNNIADHLLQVFPFFREVGIVKKDTSFGLLPVFCIKEKNIPGWIDIRELSSGIQKVILLLTDLFSLPNGSIYLLDEYENSLGINAIDVLPTFIVESKRNNQFVITSHHPYIINNIPIDNWYICYREGQKVNIKYGEEIINKYGKSKQKAFINLINDPLFTGAE